ncbi:hypothetical protein OAU13_00255 [bacterium]|nr:hypothetical protein [bacterium]
MAAFILVKLSDDDSFVVGELHNETDEEVVLKYPIAVKLKTTINQTTNVSTSKLMPFSENNIVALRKQSIVGFTKPNERIIKYYLRFLNNFQKLLDEDLENDILGLQDSYSDPLDIELDDEDIEVTVESKNSSSLLH